MLAGVPGAPDALGRRESGAGASPQSPLKAPQERLGQRLRDELEVIIEGGRHWGRRRCCRWRNQGLLAVSQVHLDDSPARGGTRDRRREVVATTADRELHHWVFLIDAYVNDYEEDNLPAAYGKDMGAGIGRIEAHLVARGTAYDGWGMGLEDADG